MRSPDWGRETKRSAGGNVKTLIITIITIIKILITSCFQITSTPPWKNKHFVLSNKVQLPAIGLGTWQIIGQESVDLAVQSALKEGYTLIDTASVYRNEALIANSISKMKTIPREELFLTSKLAPKDQGREKAKLAFEQTLRNLQTDYLDLYLIHWPGVQGIRVIII